eukprot:s1014_g3.t1
MLCSQTDPAALDLFGIFCIDRYADRCRSISGQSAQFNVQWSPYRCIMVHPGARSFCEEMSGTWLMDQKGEVTCEMRCEFDFLSNAFLGTCHQLKQASMDPSGVFIAGIHIPTKTIEAGNGEHTGM